MLATARAAGLRPQAHLSLLVEATRAVLDRIATRNEPVDAFRVVDLGGAGRRPADPRRDGNAAPSGLLDGVPVTSRTNGSRRAGRR